MKNRNLKERSGPEKRKPSEECIVHHFGQNDWSINVWQADARPVNTDGALHMSFSRLHDVTAFSMPTTLTHNGHNGSLFDSPHSSGRLCVTGDCITRSRARSRNCPVDNARNVTKTWWHSNAFPHQTSFTSRIANDDKFGHSHRRRRNECRQLFRTTICDHFSSKPRFWYDVAKHHLSKGSYTVTCS